MFIWFTLDFPSTSINIKKLHYTENVNVYPVSVQNQKNRTKNKGDEPPSTGSDGSRYWTSESEVNKKHGQCGQHEILCCRNRRRESRRWRFNRFVPGEGRTGDLLEALSGEDAALDESDRVSPALPLCCECVGRYLRDPLPSSDDRQKYSQEDHHQPRYHGEQWELEGLVYKWG